MEWLYTYNTKTTLCKSIINIKYNINNDEGNSTRKTTQLE